MDARLDPCWKESGAESAEEYACWCWRACGPACVKMVKAFLIFADKVSLILI
jgi:hypothetical protein